jgi:PAS domain S-box-containing protein
MNIFDIRTIIFNSILTDVICTVVIVALWRQSRRRFNGMEFFVLDYALQTVGVFLIVLRGTIPDFMSIVMSNWIIVAGALMGYMGLERFLNRPGPHIHNIALVAVFPLAHAYFTYITPNLSARNLNLSIALLIICFQCVWLLFKRIDRPMLTLTRWVGMVFSAYCLLFVVRIVLFFMHPYLDADYFHSGASEVFVQVMFQMLFIMLTYTLALMVNKRLMEDIQIEEEKFAKAFHAAPYAMSLTRLSDGKIYEVNEGYVNITGYLLSEVSGKTTFELQIWADIDDRAAVVDELNKHGRVQDKEVRFKTKSGGILTGLYSAEIVTINNQKSILGCFNDITERIRAERERERLIEERSKALSEIKVLSGMLPICASCKKIRDDSGYWNQIESYIKSHSEADFSHGICPDCVKKLYPEFTDDKK